MEGENMLKDDFLKKLLGRVPLESPSDGFTRKVMAGIFAEPLPVKAKKPFYLYLKAWWPWILLGIFALAFIFSSDIPYLTFIPGKDYVNDHIIPYLSAFFGTMAGLFTTSKTLSISIAVMVAGGLLYAVDWFVRRRFVAHNHAS